MRILAAGRRHELILVALLLLGLGAMVRPSIHGNDGVQNYVYVRSLLVDGDLDFSNEYEHYFRKEAGWFDEKVLTQNRDPVTSRPVNLYGVGSALLWSPWVAAAHGVLRLSDSQLADGYSRPYEWAVGLASCVYASIGLWLMFLVLRRFFPPDTAFWTVLLAWLATNLVFYMYLHPSMSHANAFLLVACVLWLYLDAGDRPLRWGLLGLVAGVLALTRFQDAVLVLPLALAEVMRGRPERSMLARRLMCYGLFAVAAFVAFFPQMAAWRVLHGSFFSGPREYLQQGSLHLLAPIHAHKVLFSSWHGLFFWHFAYGIMVAGLLFSRADVRLRAMGVAAFAVQLWVVSSWSHWWAGASFGHRMFISTLPFLAAGGAALIAALPRYPIIARIVIVLLIFWNFGLIAQYGSGMIPRQRGVSMGMLAYNNAVEIPRLMWRIAVGR